MMKKEQVLKKIIYQEVKALLKEDLMRGIPDFVLSQIASETSENLRRHLKRFINQSASDPTKQRQMLVAANEVLKELEKEVKDLLEDKLMGFNQNI